VELAEAGAVRCRRAADWCAGADALANRTLEHYRSALRAQRDGDWTRYGEEIRRLGAVLEGMRPR
jgi:transposase